MPVRRTQGRTDAAVLGESVCAGSTSVASSVLPCMSSPAGGCPPGLS